MIITNLCGSVELMLQEFRDPIHGLIELDDDELHIVNHPVFQRLRRIKQLALASYLYPGAVHTRFEHSLGVFAIAKKMAERLDLGEDLMKWIKAAALLHDIGHGPFSHVSEAPLKKYSPKIISEDGNVEEIHEFITKNIIETTENLLPSNLNEHKKDIIDILDGSTRFLPVYEVITGPFDADKQDYLLRDSYYCGVKYGIFDSDRLNHELVLEDENIMIKDEGIHVLEQFFLAKYYITNQVYKHRVRRITDNMLVRGIELGIEQDSIDFLQKLYCFPEFDKENSEMVIGNYLRNYQNWYDDALIYEIIHKYPSSKSGKLFKLIFERKLFKSVFDHSFNAIEYIDKEGNYFKNYDEFYDYIVNKGYKSTIEQEIAEELKIDKADVILDIFSLKTVSTPKRKDKAKNIMIKTKFLKPENFSEKSPIFSQLDDAIFSKINIQAYGNVNNEDLKMKRIVRERNYHVKIKEIILKNLDEAKRKISSEKTQLNIEV